MQRSIILLTTTIKRCTRFTELRVSDDSDIPLDQPRDGVSGQDGEEEGPGGEGARVQGARLRGVRRGQAVALQVRPLEDRLH